MSRRSSYSLLANEYYDEKRHPTCANFRHTSAIILRKWLPRLLMGVQRVCELGAGRSLLAEIFTAMGRNDILKRLVLTDASAEMLTHSSLWAEYGAVIKRAAAAELPYPSGHFDIVVAAAGDPYNDNRTWEEIARVLREPGYCIFTTPSYQWSVKFRRLTNAEVDAAEFELRSGKKILVPSFIWPREKQERVIRRVGLEILAYEVVRLSDIESRNVSPKLKIEDEDLPVMEGYISKKTQHP